MTTSAATSSAGVAIPAGTWTIVPSNSTAQFSVRNFGLRTVRGIVPIHDASVVVTEGGRITAVHARLHLAGIDTGNVRRDRDLRGRRLLDTEQFPDVTFDCTDTRRTADGWSLAGTLGAHGVAVAVTTEAELTGGPAEGVLTVHATARFDRRSVGVRAPRVMIGREIAIEISAEFRTG